MPYLHTIGLENFRLFRERTLFEFAPITILTGTNSSGKSSLIKSLQLLKSSLAESNSLEELSFSRGKHNLGWYGQVLNRDSEKNDLVITLDLELNGVVKKMLIDFVYTAPTRESFSGDLNSIKIYAESGEILFQITKGEFGEQGLGKGSFKQKYQNFHVKLDLLSFIDELRKTFQKNIITNTVPLRNEGQNSTLIEKYINIIEAQGWDIFELQKANIFDKFFLRFLFNHDSWIDEEENSEKLTVFNKDGDVLLKKLEELQKDGLIFRHTTVDVEVFEDFFSFGIENVIRYLDLDSGTIVFVIGDEESKEKKTPELTAFGKFVFNKFLAKELSDAISKVKELLKNVESLSSFRANTERLYHSNSEIVEINRLLWDFSIRNPQQYKSIKGFLENSLRLFGIGDEIIIKHHQGVSSEILVVKDGRETLLADLGFGFSQLVPIILKISLIVVEKYKKEALTSSLSPTIFLLEEPEGNLHPSLQSKLAEFFYDAAERFNIQFIVETHSEYMIRNFQYLTATKKLKPDDTAIYYFHKPGTKEFEESPYRKIEILEDGRLSKEFGEGFFDEIPRLLAFLYNSSFN
jgi:predicted ATPase